MIFGAHVTISPKPLRAVEEAKTLGIKAVQIFTHNPRGWQFKALDHERLQEYHDAKKEHLEIVASHCNYLINLATDDKTQYEKSIWCLEKEFEYADAFGCDYFVLHVGKHKGLGEEEGVKRVAKGINQVKQALKKSKTTLLLENVAGQGTEVGRRLENLNKILEGLDDDIKDRVGVCLDTCHAHAAGYDISTQEGVNALLTTINNTFGKEKILLVHLNDSKKEAGSRVDRHENIGKGTIGEEGIKAFMRAFEDVPMILETPAAHEHSYQEDLQTLRRLSR